MLSAMLLYLQGAATPSLGVWEIEESVEGLTGTKTVSALLDANAPVLNMLGNPDRASIVMRCKEGQLAFYVIWPQVLNTEFIAGKTVIFSRIDQQKIKTDFWDISSEGTGAGAFSTRKAARRISSLLGATEFAIRLTGMVTQDAVFNLSGFDVAAARVSAACGIKLQASAAK